jgi:5-methylcytosine-specific restriction endonuclease McrA
MAKIKAKAYRENNREKIRESRRLRNAKPGFSAMNVAKVKEWASKNPDKVKVNQTITNFNRRSKIGSKVTKKVIQLVVSRDQNICHLCHKKINKGEESIDHLIPVCLGGSNEAINLRQAHKHCNSKRSWNKPAQLLLVNRLD